MAAGKIDVVVYFEDLIGFDVAVLWAAANA